MTVGLVLPKLRSGRICVVDWLVQDIIAVLEGPVPPGGWGRAELEYHPGGGGANAAWSAGAAGADVRFVGLAGEDALAEGQIALMRSAGIETRLVRRGTTRTVICLVDETGQRQMIAGRGKLEMAPDELAERDFSDLGVLHLTAYALLSSSFGPVAWRAVEMARQGGAAISLDVGSFAHAERLAGGDYAQLAPEVTFANSDESAVLFGPGRGVRGGVVVHKRGGEATLVEGGGEVVEVAVEPVVRVVDTTGAGDAMAGGFLAGWAAGAGVVEACVLGHTQAAKVITQAGARVPLSSE